MKGISPFIATVLLIGFTISLGLAFSNWIFPLLNTQKGEIDDRSDKLFDCSKAKIFFEKNALTANGTRLTLVVENRGSTNLTDFKLYITLNDSTFYTFDKATNYNATLLPSQQLMLINTTSFNKSNVTQAFLTTGPNDNCPSTQYKAEFT